MMILLNNEHPFRSFDTAFPKASSSSALGFDEMRDAFSKISMTLNESLSVNRRYIQGLFLRCRQDSAAAYVKQSPKLSLLRLSLADDHKISNNILKKLVSFILSSFYSK